MRQAAATVQEQEQRFYPFVKWAGGKTQLLSKLDAHLPARFERYFEPFLGGGAVFFHLLSRRGRFDAFLSDVNADLINAYSVVKGDVEQLIRALQEHERRFNTGRRDYYYRLRAMPPPEDSIERAARFIMFNKTCFNGLYRVNKSGRFNVPLGRYDNPRICDAETLRQASVALNRSSAKILDRHYGDALKEARRGDLVYLDPPYNPSSSTARFTEYTNGGFGDGDQRDLAEEFARLSDRGCIAIMSNSDTPLIRRLYSSYVLHKVSAARAINCKAAGRRGHTELLICNFVESLQDRAFHSNIKNRAPSYRSAEQ
jgi:DNA adenine methylase